MASNYITNIDTGTVDSNNKQLIWSDQVLSVYYYDATASGTEETWTKEWLYSNPFVNSDFSTAVSGTGWDFVTDDSTLPYTFSLSRFASWNNTDLLENVAVTSSGNTGGNNDEYVVDMDRAAGWETPGAGGNGAYAIRMDMGSVKSVNYLWMSPGYGSDVTKAVQGYRVGISNTGGENDFTIVASGTTTYSDYTPVITFLGNQTARYIKVYIDSNHGSATNHRIWKLSAYYEPEWSLFGTKVDGIFGGNYSRVQQSVDLTGIDDLYVDSRAHMVKAYSVGTLKVLASGVGGATNDTLRTYNWGNTGEAWQNSNDSNHWTRREEKIDVSSYSGDTSVKLEIFEGIFGRPAFWGYFGTVRTSPYWYTEGASEYRGLTQEFPDEVYIVSDRKGLSLINKADLTLWMRFNIGAGYSLETVVRDIYADEGRIYLATSRGLVILDFIENRTWKYTESGRYYRLSLGRRNEYGFWFLDDAGAAVTSNDVYSVTGGVNSGDSFIFIGHGYGANYIKDPAGSSKVVHSSNFTYPVRRVGVVNDSSGDVSKIIYIGGFDSRSRVGILEDVSAVKSSDFDEDVSMYHTNDLNDDSFNGSINNQWYVEDVNELLDYGNDYITVSGVKSDYGNTLIIQSDKTPDKSFTASVDVKVDKWPERGEGGLHFGVTSGWPVKPVVYEVVSKALSLSAVNGTKGVITENESFKLPPYSDNWKYTIDNNDQSGIYTENESLHFDVYTSSSYGSSRADGTILGHKRIMSDTSFTAKLKVKCTRIDMPFPYARQVGIVFGVSDGVFLGEGAGGDQLCMSFCASAWKGANPPVYCLSYGDYDNHMLWDLSNAAPAFSGDGSTSADWHQWDFTYDHTTKTINAAVDGIFVGSRAKAALGSAVGIIIGVKGNYAGYTNVQFKDFEIDFGENPPESKKEYVIQTYDAGSLTRPTVSGTHLNGLEFFSTDDSYSSEWRTWQIDYSSSILQASVDGNPVGSPVSLSLGNSNQRVFLLYDIPATASGTEDERDTDIKIKNFTINYREEDTVISGSPNNFCLENGEYDSTEYNTLYLATSSGVNQLMYEASSTISGVPYLSTVYGIEGSNFGYEILYGNLPNCLNVEPELGAVAPSGLLYAGTSRYAPRGWERLANRTGNTGGDVPLSLTVSPDANDLYLYDNLYDNRIYSLHIGDYSSEWETIAQAGHLTSFTANQDSRGYAFDMQNGMLYCCSPQWFGFYSLVSKEWEDPTDNIGTGPVYTGGGALFDDWELAPILSKKQIYLMQKGEAALLPLSMKEWTSEYAHYVTALWGTAASACVYSEVDDCMYVLAKTSNGILYKSKMNSLVFENTGNPPDLPYNFDRGISAFYRPYDESIYFVLKGASDPYGRKIIRYDVKRESWDTLDSDVPAAVYDFVTASYSYVEDSIYLVTGEIDRKVYRYYFPSDAALRYVSWSADDDVLPENSYKARFRRVDFDSEYGNYSDSFNDSSLSSQWFKFLDGTGTAVSEGSNNITFTCPYTTQYAKAHIIRAIPVQACNFTATAKVKIRDMARSTGALAGSRNMFMLGVTDYKGTPGYRADGNNIEIGLSFTGVNGAFMIATNDVADDSNKYSIHLSELGSDTYYNATIYDNFSATDGTPLAGYRDWKIQYDQESNQIDAYIDDSLIGSASLTGPGFVHGASLYLGAWRGNVSVSGTIDVDVKDLSVSTDSDISMVSNYMKIEDNDLYGYPHYEKFDQTVFSGSGYAYESDWRITSYSTDSNVYITSLGSIEDGNKSSVLAALYNGDRKIGLYTGGDPREASSYTSVDHDWSVRSTYKVVSDSSTVGVYVDGSTAPIISTSYDSLPGTDYRRVRFGSCNPDNERDFHCICRDGAIVTTSGSWSRERGEESAYYGMSLFSNASSVDTKTVVYTHDSGDGYLYMFYSSYSNRALTTPVTVYHSGVVETPTPDSFATNPISSVSDNVDEYGNADIDATTVIVNQQRLMDGSSHSKVSYGTGTPSGWVYLGRYTDIDRAVITTDGGGGAYINADSFKIKHTDRQPKSTSVSRVYKVSYTVGSSEVKTDNDYMSGLSIIDMQQQSRIDYYGESTSPSIADGNIYDLDVIQ